MRTVWRIGTHEWPIEEARAQGFVRRGAGGAGWTVLALGRSVGGVVVEVEGEEPVAAGSMVQEPAVPPVPVTEGPDGRPPVDEEPSGTWRGLVPERGGRTQLVRVQGRVYPCALAALMGMAHETGHTGGYSHAQSPLTAASSWVWSRDGDQEIVMWQTQVWRHGSEVVTARAVADGWVEYQGGYFVPTVAGRRLGVTTRTKAYRADGIPNREVLVQTTGGVRHTLIDAWARGLVVSHGNDFHEITDRGREFNARFTFGEENEMAATGTAAEGSVMTEGVRRSEIQNPGVTVGGPAVESWDAQIQRAKSEGFAAGVERTKRGVVELVDDQIGTLVDEYVSQDVDDDDVHRGELRAARNLRAAVKALQVVE